MTYKNGFLLENLVFTKPVRHLKNLGALVDFKALMWAETEHFLVSKAVAPVSGPTDEA